MNTRSPLTNLTRLAAALCLCLLFASQAFAQATCSTATNQVSGSFSGGGFGSAPLSQTLTATGVVSGGNLNVTVTYTLTPTSGGTVTSLDVVFGPGFTSTVQTSTAGNNIAYNVGTALQTSYAPPPNGVRLPTTSLGGGAMRAQGTISIPLGGNPVINGKLMLQPMINGNFQPSTGFSARFSVANNLFTVPTDNNDTQGTCVTGFTPCQTLDSATVSASTVNEGDSINFTVNASNASSITLTDLSTGQVFNFSGSTLTITPTASTTYRVTVNGSCSNPTQDFGITVVPPPAIVSFNSNVGSVCPGGQAVLSYDTSNVASADVNGTPVPTLPSGTMTVMPSAPFTDYVLTVRGGVGGNSVTRTQTVRVNVNPSASINSFAPSANPITAGQSTRLNFSSSNSTTQTITDLATNQVFNVTGLPFLDVTPLTTRSYRYTVNGACGSTSQDIEITVNPASGSISANPNPITVCDGSGLGVTTISWSATVSSVIVKVGAPNGTVFVSGGSSGSAATGKWVSDGMVFYLQNASFGDDNSPANTLATVTVGVSSAACPAILSFDSSAPSVCPGGGVVLSYSTQNVTSGNINGTPLPSLPSGTMTVFPTAPSSNYTITVNGAGGQTATQTLTVSVTPTTSIDAFTASATTLTVGQSVTFTTGASNATSGTVTDLTSGQVINVTVPNGTATFTPAASGTRTFRFTANGTCSSPTRDLTITVNSPAAGNVLLGTNVANGTSAVGPTDNNDDYTNMTLVSGVAGPVGSFTSAGGTIVFTNKVKNLAAVNDTVTITARVIPATFTVAASVDGGATYTSLNSGGSVSLNLVAGANASLVLVRVTAPVNLPVLTGFSTVLRATSGITPTNTNETIDRLWTGFIGASKSLAVTNTTGNGNTTDAVSGAFIDYTLNYSNVTTAAGTLNVNLAATNVIVSEDGNASPNTWGATTNHVAGSASDTLGGTITGDTTGSAVLTDTVPSLAPGQSGTFKFRRRIK